MTRENTHSHGNSASDTVPDPTPEECLLHIADLESLIVAFNDAKDTAEAARPRMKPKK